MRLQGRFGRIARRLLRMPLFTSVAVMTLGLGIGANAAIFSVIRGVLLKPLPFGEPERVSAIDVTDGVLPALRVQAVIGRRFTADDDSPKSPERVMLMHGYWARKFGSDPSVIGRQIT